MQGDWDKSEQKEDKADDSDDASCGIEWGYIIEGLGVFSADKEQHHDPNPPSIGLQNDTHHPQSDNSRPK